MSRRPFRRASLVDTTPSASPTPRPTYQPLLPHLRSSTAGASPLLQLTPEPAPQPAQPERYTIPAHYHLPPTVPSPYSGTLDASLDAILHFNTQHSLVSRIVTTLLEPPDSSTDWPGFFAEVYEAPLPQARAVMEELFVLATRTLLPEQIAENRATMRRLFERRKQLAYRLLLRYDMLRSWKKEAGVYRESAISIASVEPGVVVAKEGEAMLAAQDVEMAVGGRRALLPNVMATLIAAPVGGYSTQGVRDRMRHHITGLDRLLLITDEDLAQWEDMVLVGMTAQVFLQWQWLRTNNEILDEMERGDWEDLDGKADECEWIINDDSKKGTGGKKEKAKDADTDFE